MRTVKALLVALGVVGLALLWPALPGNAQSKRWGQSYLPNVELVTQDGAPVRFYDDVLKGKIVVISFIYTSCLDICPLITARLAQVYDALGEAAGRDFHFVSISIDPARDTPERLKRHAEAFRSDPRWLFLTGAPDAVRSVRHKLGERSRKLTEHGAQILLYNDRTGEWHKDSAFADLSVLPETIRSMDPEWRNRQAAAVSHPATGPVEDMPGQTLFAKACASCHTIGRGKRVGPDLGGITDRRSREWLGRFMKDPAAVHASGDPIAADLAAAHPGARMPNLQLADADVTDLLTYLEMRTFALAAADMAGPHSHAKGKHEHGQSSHKPAKPHRH